MNGLNLQSILLFLPGIVIGFTVHEFAHAMMAYKLGDETAKHAGRLTLNPIKHIDPMGFIFMLIAGFGWAKPVQFNPSNLKHKNRDEIFISFAGPLSNLVLGVLFIVIARVLFNVDFFLTDSGIKYLDFLITCGSLNFGLFVFNVIPLPPLDGSHLYLTFLHNINPELMNKMYRYGSLVLLGIIIAESSMDMDILPIGKAVNFITEQVIIWLGFF